MAKTTANFRALRELCGVTQQHAADALGVRALTVKRWEKGETPIPGDAMEWLMGCVEEHDAGVVENLGRLLAALPADGEACLTYYRTQDQADSEAHPEQAGPYGFLNAVTRSTAERLVAMGYRVSFSYPDEERIYDGEI